MTDRDKTISPAGSPPGSPLRRRMSEDMTVRGFTPCTQRGYLAAVEKFTTFLGRTPGRAVAGALLPRRLHRAGPNRRHRLSEQGRGLCYSAACDCAVSTAIGT